MERISEGILSMKFLWALISVLGLGAGILSGASAANSNDVKPALQTEPDHPLGFGYKIMWFAIRTADGAAVSQVLGLVDPQPANWASGMAVAYEHSMQNAGKATVFVSPTVQGWTFVIGVELPYPADASSYEKEQAFGRSFRRVFSALASQFEEVQFFGTHRVVGFDAWARAKNGRVERIFSFSDGAVLVNEGPQSPEEAQLGLLDLGTRTPEEATAFIFESAGSGGKGPKKSRRSPIPDEQDTVDLAGLWSLNPTKINELGLPAGTGFVAKMPYDRSH
jgi:hypothetical protein